MNIELDVHTHTIASEHAFSTLQEMEMAQTAAAKGLKLLGITEHLFSILGTCNPIYFRNLHVVPKQMYGIELLLRAEINITDFNGNIDMDETNKEEISKQSLLIIYLHITLYFLYINKTKNITP